MSFNRANPDAKAKSRRPPLPKPNVSKKYERNADLTKEEQKLKNARMLVEEEELKRYNFLLEKENSIDWESLREFYDDSNDDHELYGQHFDMKRWRLFVELVLFLHKNSIIDIDRKKRNALQAFILTFKLFTFDKDGRASSSILNKLTSIQQLLTFIKKDKILRRKFISQHNGHNDDFFKDDPDDVVDLFVKLDVAKLDKEFEIFYNNEDDIEHNNSLGMGQKDRPPRIHQPLDDDDKKQDDIFNETKEIRKKWESKINPYTQNARRFDRTDTLRNNDRVGGGAIKRVTKLSDYFSQKDAHDIVETIYNRTMAMDGTLNDYLLAIARIGVFVAPEYLKWVAKTFNEKLDSQYYNLDSLIDLTIDEILQEIYQHPDNSDSIATITKQVDTQIERYIENIMRHLTNTPYNEYYAEQHKKSLETSFDVIKKSPSLTKINCSDDFSEVEDLDIIYYTDTDDKKVYCFKLFDLYEQFEKGDDFDNHKSGKRFNQTFIDNILSHHKKPKSPVKIKEKSSFDDVLQPQSSSSTSSSLVDIFSATEKGLDPVLKAAYEEEFGGALFGL